MRKKAIENKVGYGKVKKVHEGGGGRLKRVVEMYKELGIEIKVGCCT